MPSIPPCPSCICMPSCICKHTAARGLHDAVICTAHHPQLLPSIHPQPPLLCQRSNARWMSTTPCMSSLLRRGHRSCTCFGAHQTVSGASAWLLLVCGEPAGRHRRAAAGCPAIEELRQRRHWHHLLVQQVIVGPPVGEARARLRRSMEALSERARIPRAERARR